MSERPDDRIARRRAIEALRSGVPSRDAVHILGTNQTVIELEFDHRLDSMLADQAMSGLIVAGDFGTGKSHLLEHLQHRALTRNTVTSKVVISKETTLHDPAKVYRSAVDAAILPGRTGSALTEIATTLLDDKPAYNAVRDWARDQELNDRFSATLYLLEHARADPELIDRILRFWNGDPIAVSELRKALKAVGEGATYMLPKINARDLALQRFRFFARLVRAAGFQGWVLLFDEIELIGRYSLLQRARSYAEIARWVVPSDAERIPDLMAVLAITDDFDGAVIEAKNDREQAPGRLRATGKPEDEIAASRAERGMSAINQRLRIVPQSHESLDTSYHRVRDMHGLAYDWKPPELEWTKASIARPMRQYVRSWINEWDLRRLDPAYRPDIAIDPLGMNYTEDRDLDSGDAPETDNGREA
ncbi:MAG: BREX system ATP-binding domain-containing protein [Longimicrobiales bacterium]